MSTSTLARRRKIELGTKVAVIGVVGFIVAPYILTAIGGIVGLIAAGAVAFIAYMAAPVFGHKVANWRLKAIKDEAATNPIETMENIALEKGKALTDSLNKITDFKAHLTGYKTKVARFSADHPENAEAYTAQVEKMEALLSMRIEKYEAAQKELENFQAATERAKAIWAMAQAASAMSAAAGQFDEAGTFTQIRKEVAFESVEFALNRSFAELDSELLRK